VFTVLEKAVAGPLEHRTALVQGGRRLTYGELTLAARSFGAILQERGVTAGARVALHLGNSIEWVVAFFAGTYAGATMVLLDAGLKRAEVFSQCEHSGATLLISADANFTGDGTGPTVVSAPSVSQLLRRRERLASAHAYGPDDFIAMLLTSGTTGGPKLVPRTLAQIDAALDSFDGTLPYVEDDRVLAFLPFSHSFGFLGVLLSSLRGGAALFLETFSPRTTCATIERQRITVFPGTPFVFRLLVQTEFRVPVDFSSLRHVVSAGAALSAAVACAFEEKFGMAILQSYGSTESGPIAIGRFSDRHPGAVGRPYSGVRIEVRDAAGCVLPPGTEGAVWEVSGAVASGYLDSEGAADGAFSAGYRTGDVGFLDEEGRVFLLGRDKPMITVAGKKVSPVEVERCLLSHPSVSQVAVVGEARQGGEETVLALVVPAGAVTPAELREFCNRHLAGFKVPREFVISDDLQRGPMSKLPQRRPPH
jgi:long-chain acyl-CoA synthetase